MKQYCMSLIYVSCTRCKSLMVIAHSHHFTNFQAFGATGHCSGLGAPGHCPPSTPLYYATVLQVTASVIDMTLVVPPRGTNWKQVALRHYKGLRRELTRIIIRDRGISLGLFRRICIGEEKLGFQSGQTEHV